ncbi:hypothetical protein J2T10_001963 [Paenarthrobacter nicotinovorans]|uniref:Uncharacterized protein n=1 Tax=Paenarthrobacter nicotinovorans TaxID=29320 RepID=A0ABT9TP32_PAENI|nr:hypothetical protein [Paenarthrobacter nicotinovorans]MDQ0102317.1 hypothetical protein [Paenarthrobacter nicotinovorans]
MSELHINALLTRTGVNMGDHAQDVTSAVVLDPDMTVRELCEKHLMKRSWAGVQQPDLITPDAEKYLTIRLAADEA